MAAPALKAIIFDCYGVLVAGTRSAVKEKYPQHAIAFDDLGAQADRGYLTKQAYLLGVSKLIGETVEEVASYFAGPVVKNEKLLKTIKHLKGTYKTGVLSNISPGPFEEFFPHPEVYFDEVALSYRTALIKPHPEVYYYAAEKLGVATSECLFVDDIEENVFGAQRTGMDAFQYQNFPQLITEMERRNIDVKITFDK